MNCFNMNQKKIISNFANLFKEEMQGLYLEEDIKNFNFDNPIYLKSDSIASIMNKLDKDQKLFKNFITNYNAISDKSKMSVLTHFCPANIPTLQKHMETVFPKQKVIKTSLYAGSVSSQFKALAHVCAKKGVNLSSLKTYQPKELEELINSGKIIISHFEPHGRMYYKKQPDFIDYEFNLINLNLRPTRTSEGGRLIELANTDAIVKNTLESVNVNQIKAFYQQTYLPVYKNCLNYLLKCTEFSNQQENENIKHYEKELEEIPKKIEQNKNSITEISKLISDGGRQ